MSEPKDMQSASKMDRTDVLRLELAVLRRDHRDLDEAIAAMQSQIADPLTLQRLKRRKLALKDRIAALEDQILPDIIA